VQIRLDHALTDPSLRELPAEVNDLLRNLQAPPRLAAHLRDIGKIIHIEELSRPGSLHEKAGEQLLLEAGVAPHLARFAATHASWTEPGITVEDLLVSLADKVWKGKRVRELEQLLVDQLVIASGQEAWQVFLDLDDQLGKLTESADARLAFQNTY
jgi:hypothetical protein